MKSSICGHVANGTCAIDVVFARNFEEDAISSLELYNAAEHYSKSVLLATVILLVGNWPKWLSSSFQRKRYEIKLSCDPRSQQAPC